MSGWKVGANGFKERALDGYDVELGLPLPYMPRTKLYGQIMEWTGQTGDFSEKGLSYSFEGNFITAFFLKLAADISSNLTTKISLPSVSIWSS